MRANQMSLGDLTNDTARDATDFATEMAVDSVGAKRYRRVWRDCAAMECPPGGSAQRPLGLMY